MKNNVKKRINKETVTKALRIVSSCILCVSLMFSLMVISGISSTETTKTAPYFGLSLFFMGLYELMSFIHKRRTDSRKVDFVRLAYVTVCLAAMASAFIIPITSKMYLVPPALYLCVPTLKRIMAIFDKRKVRSKLYNVLVLIVCLFALLVTVALQNVSKEDEYRFIPLFACIAIMLTSLLNVCSMVFSQFNKEILLRIVRKTYAGEILIGLFLLVVAFSLVIMHNEESIKTFGDALWYCFAIVTTTGFGDFAAKSVIGRILSVILGVYGIVAVSILTSIIVNFYNEVKDIDKNAGAEETEIITPTEELPPVEPETKPNAELPEEEK